MSGAGESYIRGSGAAFDRARVLRIAAFGGAILVVVLAVVLAVGTLSENARIRRLQQHGVRVDATITNCVALASGTGITAAGYRCEATYVLAGHTYAERISGTRTQYSIGQVVAAVADPHDPTNLSPAGAVADRQTSLTGLILPGILVVAVLAAVLWWLWRRRIVRASLARQGC